MVSHRLQRIHLDRRHPCSKLQKQDLAHLPSNDLSSSALTEIYYRCSSRAFEEAAWQQYGLGKVHGTMHLCIGQEGVGIGAIAALRPDDYIVSTHRGHAAIDEGRTCVR